MTHFASLFKGALGDSISMDLGESTLPDTLEKIERDFSALYRKLDKHGLK